METELRSEIKAMFHVPIEWEALIAASHSCLDGYARGFVEKEIIHNLPGSITYRIWQQDLGELGTVKIRKLGIGNSEIDISGVPSNSIETAPIWLSSKSEWDQQLDDAWKEKRRNPETQTYSAVTDELAKVKGIIKAKQENHQADVIKAYFNRLMYDLNLWTSNKVMPPPYMIALAGLAEWPDKRNLSQEAQKYFEKYKLEIGKSDIQQVKMTKSKKPRQKGRYRLTKDEIKRRKKIVKDAERIFKESDPKKTWKQIAYELGIPERTLRDWRHNPEY